MRNVVFLSTAEEVTLYFATAGVGASGFGPVIPETDGSITANRLAAAQRTSPTAYNSAQNGDQQMQNTVLLFQGSALTRIEPHILPLQSVAFDSRLGLWFGDTYPTRPSGID